MEAIKLCRLDTPIIFIEAHINLSRFVVTGCAAKTSATVTFPSLNLISLFAFCFNIWLNGVASYFKIAEGQWYRYAPSYVSPAYHLLEGFPFIQEPPSGDLQERVLIRHHDYDQCFQSVQLLQWNSQVKFNVTV